MVPRPPRRVSTERAESPKAKENESKASNDPAEGRKRLVKQESKEKKADKPVIAASPPKAPKAQPKPRKEAPIKGVPSGMLSNCQDQTMRAKILNSLFAGKK